MGTVDDEVVTPVDTSGRLRLELGRNKLSPTCSCAPHSNVTAAADGTTSAARPAGTIPRRLREFPDQSGSRLPSNGPIRLLEAQTASEHRFVFDLSAAGSGCLADRSPSSGSAHEGEGVPAGSGYTGFFFGSIESKHTKTFFPWLSVGTYSSPETLM